MALPNIGGGFDVVDPSKKKTAPAAPMGGFGTSSAPAHAPGTGYTGDVSELGGGGIYPNVAPQFNPVEAAPAPPAPGGSALLGNALGAAQGPQQGSLGALGPAPVPQAQAPVAAPRRDLDLSMPGSAETEAQAQADFWNTATGFEQLGPGQGQEFAYGQLDQYGNQVGSANPTAGAYRSFQENRPELAATAGLGSYYDNAQRQMLEGINQNAAARGAYGSSAALAEGNEGIMNLRAQQANREADYNLQRAAENRAWEQLGGNLAGQQSSAQNLWSQNLANQGLSADRQRAELAAGQGAAAQGRMGQGMQNRAAEQAARENRIGRILNFQQGREGMFLPQVMNWQNQTFASDADLFGAGQGGNVGAATASANIDAANKGQLLEDAGAVANIGSSIYGATK